MGLWDWIQQNLYVESWGITPKSLLAPIGLVALLIMAGRFARGKGPQMNGGAIAGGILIAVIVGAAFVWILAGLGLLQRTFG